MAGNRGSSPCLSRRRTHSRISQSPGYTARGARRPADWGSKSPCLRQSSFLNYCLLLSTCLIRYSLFQISWPIAFYSFREILQEPEWGCCSSRNCARTVLLTARRRCFSEQRVGRDRYALFATLRVCLMFAQPVSILNMRARSFTSAWIIFSPTSKGCSSKVSMRVNKDFMGFL